MLCSLLRMSDTFKQIPFHSIWCTLYSDTTAGRFNFQEIVSSNNSPSLSPLSKITDAKLYLHKKRKLFEFHASDLGEVKARLTF